MTRVNAGIDPKELKRAHLVAELREIVMVPSSLKRSLRTRTPSDILEKMPRQFTLNTGHVSFFYNKLGYLRKRFHALADEMLVRGYAPNRQRESYFDGFDEQWNGDWNPTEKDNAIVRERIAMRIAQKPHLYKD